MKKIYLDELEEKENEIVSYSQTNIKEKIDELNKLTNGFIWEGKAHDSYIMGYNKKINKLLELNEGLTKIGKFLLSVKDNYQDANNRVNNAYEELLAEFKKLGIGDNDELQ